MYIFISGYVQLSHDVTAKALHGTTSFKFVMGSDQQRYFSHAPLISVVFCFPEVNGQSASELTINFDPVLVDKDQVDLANVERSGSII